MPLEPWWPVMTGMKSRVSTVRQRLSVTHEQFLKSCGNTTYADERTLKNRNAVSYCVGPSTMGEAPCKNSHVSRHTCVSRVSAENYYCFQRTIFEVQYPTPCVPVSDITAYSAVRGKNSQNSNKHTAEVLSLKWLSNRSQPPARSVQGDSREQALDQPEVSNSFHDEIPALQQPVGFMRSLHCRSFGTLFLLLATRLLVHSIRK